MIIKKVTTIAALAALSAFLGCKPAGQSDRSSADTTDTSPAVTRQDNTLTPTSRDTNSASRSYSDSDAATKAATSPPNNSGKNARDRADATLTPEDQGGSEADREMTRQIRRALTQSDTLSTAAKNVKIITVNGKVTLRGPVNNDQEKQAIFDAAQKAAGAGSVDNQLEIKATNQ